MEIQDKHQMILAAEHPDGSQEWSCPICGRRMLMRWQPSYSCEILDEGFANAVHSGEVNGISIDQPTIEPPEALNDQAAFIEDDDPYLSPFKAWMEKREE